MRLLWERCWRCNGRQEIRRYNWRGFRIVEKGCLDCGAVEYLSAMPVLSRADRDRLRARRLGLIRW